MLHYPRLLPWIIIGCVLFSAMPSAAAGDTKDLVRQAKAAIRAAENTNDAQMKNTKLDEARKLIDQIKAVDPRNAEIGTLENKYRYMDTGRQATKAAASTPEVDMGKLKEVLDDWNAIIKLDKDLYAKTNRFFPHAEGFSYTKEQTDQVLSVIDDVVKNDQPRILAYLKEFSRKYGEPNNEMDKKIYALTPKNPKKGMYDEENQRPSDLPSRCYKNLMDRLTWVQESPKKEAKLIMKHATEMMRDAQFVEAEAKLNLAKRFNPKDTEIAQALVSVQANRKKSQGDVQKALESARFPANVSIFAGPGKIPELAAVVKTYFAGVYPKEKVLAVSVSGGWVATKHNILGQPIQ